MNTEHTTRHLDLTAHIRRDYTETEVAALRPSIKMAYTLAQHGAMRLRKLIEHEAYVHTFGAYTGAQAVQMVKAGLKAIYLSGWQVAADGNLAGQTYPDQSLYPANSMPTLVKRMNNALMRADQSNEGELDFFVPLVADAEAGFGGPLHAYELTRSLIEAGAAGIHFEDQLAAEKKCGHLGGKVLVPTAQMIRTLKAARLAADVMQVPTIIMARTDAEAATLLTSDVDERDHRFLKGSRTVEGYFEIHNGIEAGIARGLAYAPYADLLWMETKTPNLDEAQAFADAIHTEFPGMPLAYNCSPSFNWSQHLGADQIAVFQRELGRMGYKFQFITLAGWHTVNFHTFNLAQQYAETGMTAYTALQQAEFAKAPAGYTAVRHQQEVGTGYFDKVLETITGGQASTVALAHSTEAAQF